MKVTVTGADMVIERMRVCDKAIYAEMQKEIRQAMTTMNTEVRAGFPGQALGNWGRWMETRGRTGKHGSVTVVAGRDLSYNVGTIVGSVKSSFRSFKVGGSDRAVSGRVYVANPAGAIYLLAGSRSTRAGGLGANLLSAQGGGPWPRIMTNVWRAHKEDTVAAIEAAISRATAKV